MYRVAPRDVVDAETTGGADPHAATCDQGSLGIASIPMAAHRIRD
jgi:hypothetical protein